MTASEAIRRVAALWGPARSPRPVQAQAEGALPSLIRLDPSTGDAGRQRLRSLLLDVGVRMEGEVECRPGLVWPSEARSRHAPPLLVLTSRHAVVFEREHPAQALADLHSVARARGLTPRAIWIGGPPFPEGWQALALEQLLEHAR